MSTGSTGDDLRFLPASRRKNTGRITRAFAAAAEGLASAAPAAAQRASAAAAEGQAVAALAAAHTTNKLHGGTTYATHTCNILRDQRAAAKPAKAQQNRTYLAELRKQSSHTRTAQQAGHGIEYAQLAG